ncbi:putative secreted protein [Colletotrichum spinosum]|uniref:Putative secreted protein n=1 Tax=Colletotrichum spinosum TaxID=1347390 RepID=A0A4R8QHR6_9PEZI|nr:putative secreted protein [Colletotrichum spinosum]
MTYPHRSRRPLPLPAILTIGAIIIVTLYLHSPLQLLTMSASSTPLENLELGLSQSGSSPPSIAVSVKNAHPDAPVTILKWNSPLDPAVLGLGYVTITPAGASEPLRIDAIKIGRKMPPGAESLVTLRPGESAQSVVELREPRVPEDVWKAGKAKVTMKGRWMAVWPGLTAEEVLQDPKKLQSVGAGAGSLTGDWETGSLEVGN